MAVLPIRLFGDPVLTTPADAVTTFDAELRRLVRNLDQTLYDQRGSGLAAPQAQGGDAGHPPRRVAAGDKAQPAPDDPRLPLTGPAEPRLQESFIFAG